MIPLFDNKDANGPISLFRSDDLEINDSIEVRYFNAIYHMLGVDSFTPVKNGDQLLISAHRPDSQESSITIYRQVVKIPDMDLIETYDEVVIDSKHYRLRIAFDSLGVIQEFSKSIDLLPALNSVITLFKELVAMQGASLSCGRATYTSDGEKWLLKTDSNRLPPPSLEPPKLES